ncbi:MAG TPA: sialidase family protein [Actinomycetota bacterium]|nr:sialidase family protein [Actinomycetota bacterium]
MRRIKLFLAPILLASLLPLTGAAESSPVRCPSVKPAPLKFGKPSFIDKTRAGGEPVSIIADDGSIIVSAHAGTTHVYKDPQALPGAGDFAGSYYNQTLNWRSTDGGKTWQYVGLAGAPAGPHSPTSTGFSDPDLTKDAAGNIYNVEINLANVSVFASPDDGQSWPTANPVAASGDRPWVTGQEENEVFLYVNLPKSLWRSTDGGLTFTLVGTEGDVGPDSKMISDPLNPKSGLLGPLDEGGVSISKDDGATWTDYPAALGDSTQFFGAIAADRAGWVYAANAGGYSGSNDTTADGSVTFNYFNRKTKKWAPRPIEIPIPKGDALWPWIIAGDDGRVAITWYQTLAGKPDEFRAYVAYTMNGHGSRVKCSDGSTRFVPPQFEVADATGRPIHRGKICLSGTTCNANPSFEGGDRRLGDFFTVNFDHKGTLFIVSGDTTLPSPTGGPKPVANPIFVKQVSGDKMLRKPDRVRPTRCLFPLPSC